MTPTAWFHLTYRQCYECLSVVHSLEAVN